MFDPGCLMSQKVQQRDNNGHSFSATNGYLSITPKEKFRNYKRNKEILTIFTLNTSYVVYPQIFANLLFLVSTVLGIIVSPGEIEELSRGKQGVLWAM